MHSPISALEADITVAAARSENSSYRWAPLYLDGGEIVPGRAWLGRYHLDSNNEDGRDHDKGNGLRLAHVQPLFLSS